MVPKPGSRVHVSAVDGSPVRVSGLSLFRAGEMFRRGEDLGGYLDRRQAEAKGRINTIRWMASKPSFPGFPGHGMLPIELLEPFHAFLRQRGLTGYCSLVTEVHSDLSWVAPYVEVLRGLDNAWVEGVNEPDGRKNDPSQLEPYGVLTLPRYTNGYYDPASKWRGTHFDVHPDRKTDGPPTPSSPYQTAGEHYDMASQAKTTEETFDGGAGWFAGAHVGCIHGEPGKFEDFGGDVRAIRQFYQGCSLMSAGAIVHTLNSQFGWEPTDLDAQALPIAFDALWVFPVNAPTLAFSHDTNDEKATHAMNTYRKGQYGCRFGSQLLAPELIGV